ncbi:MAG TPA: TonB-dependent receptor, partial [Bryobacteraceae bacterium]|nr:TonB-dependent receptor [Bryobacteraceae bacterium]
PLTGLPFEGNRIPQNRISPVSQYALQFIPTANDVDPATGLQRLYYQPQPTFRRTFLSTAVFDHNITTNHRFHHSWSRRENIRHRDPGNLIPQDNPLTEMRFQNYNTNQWRASLDSTLRPNVLNHVNLSADRVRSTNGTLTSGMNFVQGSGLAGVQNTHTPVQDIAGYMTLGNAELNEAMETRFEIAENLTWVAGAHSVKFGADIRRSYWNLAPADRSAGIFRFRAAQTSSVAGAGGDAFASYLLGSVQSAQMKLNTMYPGWIYPYYALFVQDDWKATRRVTLNLGLRYDINVPRHERTGRYSGLNPSLPNPAAGGIPGALEFRPEQGSHFDKTHHGFAPRLGMTLALDDKTIIQTGYGIAYMQWYYNDFAERMTAGFDAEPIRESPSREQAFNWSNGFPQDFARPPFSDPSSLNRDVIDYLDPNAKPPYMQNWNFGIQRQVARDLVVNVAYVGTKGTRLYSRFEVNRLRPAYLGLGDLLTRRIDDPAVAAAGFAAPYPNFVQDWGSQATLARALRRFPQYNSLRFYNPTVGDSSYHSLQVKVDKRFSAGLQFLATYTFAKHLTNADAANRNDSTNYQNDYALGLEKSVSGSDRPHVFNLSYIYELP